MLPGVPSRKPNATGGATVKRRAAGIRRDESAAVLQQQRVGAARRRKSRARSALRSAPITTPFGLMNQKSAPGIWLCKAPSRIDAAAPVTRLTTFVVGAGERARERGRLAGAHVEVAEAVKQVAADLRAERVRDRVARPGERARGAERAVDDDLRRDRQRRERQCRAASARARRRMLKTASRSSGCNECRDPAASRPGCPGRSRSAPR